jgi:outer membrane protein
MSRSAAFLSLSLTVIPFAALAQSAPLYPQNANKNEQRYIPVEQPHYPASAAKIYQLASTAATPWDSKTAALASETPEQKPWSLTLGAGVGYGSLYQGGAEREVFPLPVIEATYYNWSFGFGGLRYNFLNTDEFVMGAGLGYDFGRQDNKDSVPARARGIGDIDGGAVASLFAEYRPHELIGLSVDVSQSYGDAESLLVTFGAGSEFPLYGDSLSGNLGVSATWANEDHMRAYYGVNAAQATRTGLRRFNAESGIESVNVSAGVTYMITERWAYSINGGVDVLQGDAADSPIIEDDVQPFIFNTISYTF